jgi:Cof subfamily protein (haloacid dehalogenase superfamily)
LDQKISALISDVDGTVVTSKKEVTARTRAAAARLRERGIALAVISGRPPEGMRMLIEPLGLTTPIGGFNGGAITRTDMTVIEERLLPRDMAHESAAFLQRQGISVWVFSEGKWYVRDPQGPHVDKEGHATLLEPVVVADFDRPLASAHKIVGVNDDHAVIERLERDMAEMLEGKASASRSQPYYLDITHPLANKGDAVGPMAHLMGVPMEEVAVIGDGLNDTGMFAKSPLSIAMGNASDEVKRHARFTTDANDAEGWASAVEKYVLGERP